VAGESGPASIGVIGSREQGFRGWGMSLLPPEDGGGAGRRRSSGWRPAGDDGGESERSWKKRIGKNEPFCGIWCLV
jgi:hypothetical protein